MSEYVELLEISRTQDIGDGDVVWVGDGGHKGTDVYWSKHLSQWVFVDLENRRVSFADKVAVYESEADGDETRLNQVDVVAMDLDGRSGIWVVGLDEEEEAEHEDERVFLLWTDSSAVCG